MFVLTKNKKRSADRHIQLYKDLTSKKPSKDNIMAFSEVIGLPYHMASRFFQRKCECGTILQPYEVSMYLRYCGRYDNLEEDTRPYLCKECFCKRFDMTGKQYWLKVYENINEKCTLF